MSQENVEVVLRQFEHTNARDFAAAMEAYADDVTLVAHWGLGLLSPTATGKRAVGEWFGDWFSQFASDYRFDIEDARGRGDRVFILATHHGHGRGSGARIQHRMAYAYTVREGKVKHVELWADENARAAALEAVGLSVDR
jgi:ketosteroid isomerase-like protein